MPSVVNAKMPHADIAANPVTQIREAAFPCLPGRPNRMCIPAWVNARMNSQWEQARCTSLAQDDPGIAGRNPKAWRDMMSELTAKASMQVIMAATRITDTTLSGRYFPLKSAANQRRLMMQWMTTSTKAAMPAHSWTTSDSKGVAYTTRRSRAIRMATADRSLLFVETVPSIWLKLQSETLVPVIDVIEGCLDILSTDGDAVQEGRIRAEFLQRAQR